MKRYIIFLLIVIVTVGFNNFSFSQDEKEIELTALRIISEVDEILEYPKGLSKGSLMHIFPNGKSYNLEFSCSTKGEDFLFVFSSDKRGDEVKVLYNLGGDEIWVYEVPSQKLFNKQRIDRYDPILETNFSFYNLSNADYKSNFSAKIIGDAVIKSEDVFVLDLEPIFKGGAYGYIRMYVTKDDFIPLRIDFNDPDMVVFKTLSISQVAEMKGRIFPVRYDMLDLKKGTLTILTFDDFDTKMKFQDDFFRSQNLGKY